MRTYHPVIAGYNDLLILTMANSISDPFRIYIKTKKKRNEFSDLKLDISIIKQKQKKSCQSLDLFLLCFVLLLSEKL